MIGEGSKFTLGDPDSGVYGETVLTFVVTLLYPRGTDAYRTVACEADFTFPEGGSMTWDWGDGTVETGLTSAPVAHVYASEWNDSLVYHRIVVRGNFTKIDIPKYKYFLHTESLTRRIVGLMCTELYINGVNGSLNKITGQGEFNPFPESFDIQHGSGNLITTRVRLYKFSIENTRLEELRASIGSFEHRNSDVPVPPHPDLCMKLPKTAKHVGDSCFNSLIGPSEDTLFELHEGLVSIGSSSFSRLTVPRVVLPKSLVSIGQSSFECEGLTSSRSTTLEFSRPSSIATLPERVFFGCRQSYIVLPDGITSLPKESFYNYYDDDPSRLVSLVVPSSVELLGDRCFAGAFIEGQSSSLQFSQSSRITELRSSSFNSAEGTYPCKVGKIHLPDSDPDVDSDLFHDNDYLRELYIPSNFNKFTASMLAGCHSIVKLSAGEGHASIRSFDNGKALVRNASDFDIVRAANTYPPARIKLCQWFGPYSFSGYTPVSGGVFTEHYIDLSEASYIGEGAFYKCTGINKIYLWRQPCNALPDKCFYGASNIEHIWQDTTGGLCTRLVSIGDDCFRDCSSLTYMYTGSSVPPNPFIDMSANDIVSIGDRAFKGCTSIVRIGFPTVLSTVGEQVFMGCSSLTEVDLSLTAITSVSSPNLFTGCTSLETVRLPSSCESIGGSDFMFSGIDRQVNVYLPYDGVVSVGSNTNVFSGLSAGATIKVHVPSHLVNSYNNSTYWALSIYRSSGKLSIVSI